MLGLCKYFQNGNEEITIIRDQTFANNSLVFSVGGS